MAQLISDRRDVDFVLHEQLNVGELSKNELFQDFNKKTVDLIISEARNLAIKEFLPTQKVSDTVGAQFDNGKVTVPEEFHRIYSLLKEGEWVAMPEAVEWGGQGMPKTVCVSASEYFLGANFSFMMYAGLTHGAGKLVDKFGTQKQKELFLKKLYTGEWTGTMLLTEPEAGSDVGALTTTAVKNDDGTYSITGNKIFISGGEHNLAENIVHPVLARIEGAPAGTKGISLFLVPKYWVNDDGSIGEFNDVVCTGIEEKMGIHGNATCSLALGGSGKCRGTLLGEENKGMRAMFVMMNEERLLVGLQGFGCASAAYMYALNYARERVQGKSLKDMADKNAGSVPIIQHPDVRRQLMLMKVNVEAMRSIIYYVGYLEDMLKTSTNAEDQATYQGLIDVLVPIAKGYITDRAFEVCSHAVQVYGGYGYIKEYPVEQLLRDCRITLIYEGTNGIQAIDMLGRKLGLNKGKAFMDLMQNMQQTVEKAKSINETKVFAETMDQALKKMSEVAIHMGKATMSANIESAFAFAHPFLEAVGDMVAAWMLLWRASVAAEKLAKGAKKKDSVFYNGQLKSAEFYTQIILPITLGKMDSILKMNASAVEIEDASFGG